MGFREDLKGVLPLTPEEESVLLEALASGNLSREQRDRLVEGKLLTVVDLVLQMEGTGLPEEDLVQLGAIGLLRAMDRYAEQQDVPFDTLVLEQANRQIREFLEREQPDQARRDRNDRCHGVKEPAREADLYQALEKLDETERAVISMRMGLNGEEGKTQAETAQALGLSEQEVSRLLRKAQNRLRRYL